MPPYGVVSVVGVPFRLSAALVSFGTFQTWALILPVVLPGGFTYKVYVPVWVSVNAPPGGSSRYAAVPPCHEAATLPSGLYSTTGWVEAYVLPLVWTWMRLPAAPANVNAE